MAIISAKLQVNTTQKLQALDISGEVFKLIKANKIEDGLALLYIPHTTCAIYINEPENGLLQDLKKLIRQIVPQREDYLHNRVDDNATAHLASIILGNSAVIPISQGEPQLGTWQHIFLLEFDGPRSRNIIIKLIS